MEHTTDAMAAMEIALDHLNEMPDYYTKLADMESQGPVPESHRLSETQQFILQKGAWEMTQLREDWKRLSPNRDRKAEILNKALLYIEKLAAEGRGRQDIGGYAFDVFRAFKLDGIASARELTNLYHDWKGTEPHGGSYFK